MVGTCASTAAPTISPMGRPLLHLVRLDLAVEVEGVVAALAADAADARAAEGRREVTDQEAVDPEGAGADGGAETIGPGLVAGEDHRREPVGRRVGEGYRLLLGVE